MSMMSVRHSRLSSCTFYGGGGCVCSIHDHMSVQTWGGELRECSNVTEQHNTAPDKATPDLPWVQQSTGIYPDRYPVRFFTTDSEKLPRMTDWGNFQERQHPTAQDLVYKPTHNISPGIDTRPCMKRGESADGKRR